MKFIPCDEHEDCKETIPIFETTGVKPDSEVSKLYIMDIKNIEIPHCDCIDYDMNGNPRCSMHKGKLQEFYSQHDIITGETTEKNHILKEKTPYCYKHLNLRNKIIKKGYITCKNCIIQEFKARQRKEIELDGKEGFFYTTEELKCVKFPVSDKLRDLK